MYSSQPSTSPLFHIIISNFQGMKKTYIQPQTMVELAECEALIAASLLTTDSDSQSIQLTNDEYDGEFSAKEYSFGDDF